MMTTSTNTRARLALAALAVAILVGSMVGATQYTAARLAYSRRLGPPLAVVAETRVYVPWAWLVWSERFERAAPRVFATADAIVFGGALAAFALLLVAARAGRSSARSTAHGSARWAAAQDLGKAGLLDQRGVVLCQTEGARYSSTTEASGIRWTMRRAGRLVRHDGPEHVFVFAPTRSGKGVGIVIPTLLSWSRSVLVYDIKKELWTLTAGWRRQFSRLLAVRADGDRLRELQPAARDPARALGGQGHAERRRHPGRSAGRPRGATTGSRRRTRSSWARSSTSSTPSATSRSRAWPRSWPIRRARRT